MNALLLFAQKFVRVCRCSTISSFDELPRKTEMICRDFYQWAMAHPSWLRVELFRLVTRCP
jgi:hypothetical protein